MKEFILMLCQKTDLCQSTQLISEFIIVYWYLSAEQWWRGELIASKSASLDIARKRLMYTTNLYDKFITTPPYLYARLIFLPANCQITHAEYQKIPKIWLYTLTAVWRCLQRIFKKTLVCIEKSEMVVLLESYYTEILRWI